MYRAIAALLLGAALASMVLEVAAAVLLHLVAPVSASGSPPAAPPPLADAPVTGASSPYYRAVPWGTVHWRELNAVRMRTRYEPYVMWRRPAVRGATITVDSLGNRRTPGAQCGEGALRVFVFGGSTTWGYGVPDSATIPAFMQRELSARLMRPVCVVNYGELGHTSTQSLLQLMARLRDGDAPDMAVFYDGVNDLFTSDQYDQPGLHGDMNLYARRLEHRPTWWESLALARLAFHLFGVGHAPARDRYRHTLGVSPPELAERTAQVYLANIAMARSLSRAHGVEHFAFWQPNLLATEKPLTPEERLIRSAGKPGRRMSPAFAADVYERVRRAADSTERLYSLAGLFANETRLLYLDWQHLLPEGNELVARRIVRELERGINRN
jgi:lysophospholipase L1-like esterase